MRIQYIVPLVLQSENKEIAKKEISGTRVQRDFIQSYNWTLVISTTEK